ncbi:MAG: putative sigma regulatory protein MucB/RseB, partial [Frankiales bacterium]|nr:putative sigma regulatory protein MucB/RseB [Frankiales bacterium]
ASALPDRRVAGRGAAGLRLTPADPGSTTVRSVDLWLEPRTGLALRVEVVARGQERPSLTTTLLDLDLSPPPARRTAFQPPPEASVAGVEAPDVASMIDQFAPYALPDVLAGLPRRERLGGLTGGVATYGDGFTSMVLLPLPRDIGRRVLRGLDPGDTDDRAAVTTPLVTAGVVRIPNRGGWFLLAGTVPRPLLDTALAAVLADPPARLR